MRKLITFQLLLYIIFCSLHSFAKEAILNKDNNKIYLNIFGGISDWGKVGKTFPATELSNEAVYGFAVGKQFSKKFRFDVSLESRDNYKINYTNVDTSDNWKYQYNLRVNSLAMMMNSYAEINNDNKLLSEEKSQITEIGRGDLKELKSKDLHIPKIFHRIWMSWDSKNPDIPVKYKEFDTILKNLHPDWQFMEWNDANVKEFVSNFYPDFLPTYLSYDIPVKAHDAARYLIVNHFGGVFIQHSIKLQKNIEPLLMYADLVVSKQSKDSSGICNGFFASIPGHGFWHNFISRDLKIHASEKNALQATGPDIFTKSLSNYIRNEGSNGVVYLDY